MVKTIENKLEMNNCNAHIANQFKVKDSNSKKVKQTKPWPLAFRPVTQDSKVFPKSWSASPVNGHIFKSVV